jgi:hypothetical protein
MLHGQLVGIFKHLQRCLFDALPAAAYRALSANMALMAFAYSDGVSVFSGFDHASDLKTLSQLDGHGRDSLLHYLLVALQPNVSFGSPATDAARRADVQWVFLTAMQIVTVARGRPSAEEMKWLDDTMPVFMRRTAAAFPDQKSDWDFPKFHALRHLVRALREWGSCANTSMSFFEWLHGRVKRDAEHLNYREPMAVALARRATTDLVVASLPALQGEVELLDTLGPPGGMLAQHSLTCAGASATIESAVRNALAASGVAVGGGALSLFSRLDLRRVHNCVTVAKTSIYEGDIVRCERVALRDMPLFSVVCFFRTGGVDYVFARAATAEGPADAPLAGAAFPPGFDTHVRVVRPESAVVFRADNVWNKVWAPPALIVAGAAADRYEAPVTVAVPGKFVFAATLERRYR